MPRSQGTIEITLKGIDEDEDPLTFSAIAREHRPLWELDEHYGFYRASSGYAEDYLGMGEKWIQAAKDGDNWYVILPNGELRRWLGGSSVGPVVVTLDPAVHANPALLHSPDAPAFALHDLDERYGFHRDGSGYFEDTLGRGEKWIRAADEGDSWHVILPGGELHRWLGGITLGPVLASVGPAVHANPALLHDAEPAEPLPVTFSFSGEEMTIDPDFSFVGVFRVIVTASDGVESDSQSFLVTVTNQAPTLAAIPDQTLLQSAGSLLVILEAADPDGDPLTFSAIAREHRPLWELDEHYGFYRASSGYAEDYLGMGEKWIRAAKDGDNWYVILPSGELRRWLGGSSVGPVVVTLDPAVHANPALLHSPDAPAFALHDLDERYGFHRDGSGYFEDTLGRGEKWIRAAGEGDSWHVILPGGELHRWLGGITLGPVLASVGPAVHANPALLHDAEPAEPLPVTFSFSGEEMTITPVSGFDQTIRVIVTVSDGLESDARSFLVAIAKTVPPLVVTSVSLKGNEITFSWTGGSGPYTLQKKTSIADDWIDEAAGIQGTRASVIIKGDVGIFRIRGR